MRQDAYTPSEVRGADAYPKGTGLNEPANTPNAIDLYGGIGGWGLGLKMAGIEVLASYERDAQACNTQTKNQGAHSVECDIRKKMPFLPSGTDFVVGSPPCTEFSFSNKGGKGDIADGLKDIARFLRVVEEVNPKYWVLENVPRLKKILYAHVYEKDGKLRRFKHLFDADGVHLKIIDMSKFGLPQRRLRCIAGRFPAELLDEYAKKCPGRTLGDVLESLGSEQIHDPLYGFSILRSQLTEHEIEPSLSREEIRLNRSAKRLHPVYNRMEFPDSIDRPVRSITATCTRVSRESIVINSFTSPRNYRRLTIRERACLQGFPITYQFYANSHSKKIEQIGNAIPPLFVYYLGCALREVAPSQLKHPHEIQFHHSIPTERPPFTLTSGNVRRYPPLRRFRAAIPYLRFKSGVRFEFANHFRSSAICWRVTFYFGNSKDIRVLRPDGRQNRHLETMLKRYRLFNKVASKRRAMLQSLANPSAAALQRSWTHRETGIGPHAILRALNSTAKRIAIELKALDRDTLIKELTQIPALKRASAFEEGNKRSAMNKRKFEQNAKALLAGLIITGWYNSAKAINANAPERWVRREKA